MLRNLLRAVDPVEQVEQTPSAAVEEIIAAGKTIG
jgi:hypothetical protein